MTKNKNWLKIKKRTVDKNKKWPKIQVGNSASLYFNSIKVYNNKIKVKDAGIEGTNTGAASGGRASGKKGGSK